MKQKKRALRIELTNNFREQECENLWFCFAGKSWSVHPTNSNHPHIVDLTLSLHAVIFYSNDINCFQFTTDMTFE